MTRKDYYEVLGVPENADPEAIKKAHRNLAKKYHPDRHRDDKEADRKFAEKKFLEVQEAYDVLGDPEKRKRYDQLRKAGPGGFAAGDFEDLFGGGGGGGGGFGGFGGSIFDLFERLGMGRGGRAGARRGEDLAAEVAVPFETAAFGGRTTIRVPRTESCAVCSGSGAAPGTGVETCSTCGGAGTVSSAQGGFAFSRPCPRCMGRGRIVAKPCPNCRGAGVAESVRELEVKIPAGVADGGKIRLRGEGEAGRGGAPPGDLILTVRVASHANLKRDGLDVESDLVIGVADAVLGVERPVSTLSGPVSLKIPPGTQPGTRLRLRGKGIRDHKGRTGDHYVRVKVEIPRRPTDRQRELYEQLRSES